MRKKYRITGNKNLPTGTQHTACRQQMYLGNASRNTAYRLLSNGAQGREDTTKAVNALR